MKRRLQYWRALDKLGNPAITPRPVDIVSTLEDARQKGSDRHWECRNGMTVLAHPVTGPQAGTIILDRVRTGNYPSAGDADGNRRPIPLGDEDVLLEPTYAMFLNDGIIALLTGGEGPHAQRLAEYMREKFGVDWTLEPVLRDDLDEILEQMRITELQVAVPVDKINRDLVGGDWYEALESGKRLAEDGVVRIGMSIGRKGDQAFKQRLSDAFRQRVGQLRQSLGLQDFNSAKVRGQRNGDAQTIDLLEDRLVHSVEVEDDIWFDTERSIAYASEVLQTQIDQGQFSDLRVADDPKSGRILPFNPGRSRDAETH